MFHTRVFRSGKSAAPVLALLTALILIVLAALRPSGASAQTAITCPNGTVVFAGQTCPISGYQYCNGAYIAPGQVCSSTTITCPYGKIIGQTCVTPDSQYCNGTYVAPGQYCGNSYTTCSNGQQVLAGQICPTAVSSTCLYGQAVYPGQPCAGSSTVTYSAGWNLVAGPSGTVITGNSGPLYAFPPGSTAYQPLGTGSPLQAGSGYWAYFPTATTSSVATPGPGSVTVQLPPGQFVLVGNPGNTTASISGAVTVVLTYNPSAGNYIQTSQLAPGQGAWVVSFSGGSVTITNTAGLPPAPPTLPPPPPYFPPQVSTGSGGNSSGEQRGERHRRGDGDDRGDGR